MSRVACWLALVVVTAVFWVGLIAIAMRAPLLAAALAAVVCYAMIVAGNDEANW